MSTPSKRSPHTSKGALRIGNYLLDLLYPPKCLLCEEYGQEVVCAQCQAGFAAIQTPVCVRCGEAVEQSGHLCQDCEKGTAYYFAQARAAGRFEGKLRQAVLRLKYHERRRLASPLGEWLADFLRGHPFETEKFDLLIPVPLHPTRLRERGFNQAALIAREVGKWAGIPVDETSLYRCRRTRPQVELRAGQRAANVLDAFAVHESEQLKGKTVLLVDDVLTTLATSDECARVLVNAGAKAVYVVGVARGG